MSDRIFIAKHAFWYHDEKGDHKFVGTGTRVREGHALLAGREHLFREDDVLEPDAPAVAVKAAKPAEDEAAEPARRGRPRKAD
jgi:hypothetical protein